MPDAVTQAVLSAAGSSFVPGFVGLLDAQGGALASMDLSPLGPLPVSMLGVNMQFAPLALNGARLESGAPLFVEWQ